MNVKECFEKLRPSKFIIANEIDIDFESILEVGCYYGESLSALEKKYPDKRIVGIDVDSDILTESRPYLSKAITTYGDGRGIHFKDKSFDIVFTNALICMLAKEDVERVISEILRVAKRQVFFIELWCEDELIGIRNNRTAVNWRKMFPNAEIRKITKEEWDVEPWLTYGYLIKLTL